VVGGDVWDGEMDGRTAEDSEHVEVLLRGVRIHNVAALELLWFGSLLGDRFGVVVCTRDWIVARVMSGCVGYAGLRSDGGRTIRCQTPSASGPDTRMTARPDFQGGAERA
jgi:hypothetical protein